MRRRSGRLRASLFTLVAGLLLGVAVSVAPAADAADYSVVSGAGSTWSQVAIDAWRVDMRRSGVVVNYAGYGSTDGRGQFINGTADFGVSEIPFQLQPQDGSPPEVSSRPYAYLPIVAGGTSFMYHLTVGGRPVTDLRLSGSTISKIFTGLITDWSDPQITEEYGKALPAQRIVPIVRSDGSGTTAQFTLYMSKQFPSIWNPFCQKYAGLRPPCGLTSIYPQFPGSKAQSGSNGVSNYVAASYGEGSITYVEYAYPKALGFPVAKVLNRAGYYTGPTAGNVAVALTQAKINSDLTQNLNAVYTNSDSRTYPLSSYSYMIVPIDEHPPFNARKGRTLSTFIDYFLCGGQQKAEVLGYSPLPQNLVTAGFQQVQRIPGFVAPPSLATCNNPALSILRSAPGPSACDKAGTSNPCVITPAGGPSRGPTADPTGGSGTGGQGGASGGGGTQTGGGTATRGGTQASGGPGPVGATPGGAAGAGPGAARPAGSPALTAGPGAAPPVPGSGAKGVDPETGQLVSGAAAGGATPATALGTQVLVGDSLTKGGTGHALAALAALELALVIALPPIVATLLRRSPKARRR